MFDKAIKFGLPCPCYGNGKILAKEDFKERLLQKRNEVPAIEVLEGKISGEKVIDRIKLQFHMWMNLKILFKDLDQVSYATHIDIELSLDALKSHKMPIGKEWKLVTRFSKLPNPQKKHESRQTSSRASTMT